VIPDRIAIELERLTEAPAKRIGAPLCAVALLARTAGDLDPAAGDALATRRHRAAARRLAAVAIDTAVAVHGAFGDRPEANRSRARALAAVRERILAPEIATMGFHRALGEVARAVLELPLVAEDDGDWQLGALAFADEEVLRGLYDACLALAAVAVRGAAAA
jgi:hypothetical protein